MILNYRSSCGITFIMPRTFEKVPLDDYCSHWASFMATKPSVSQIEAVLYSVFELFSKDHPTWNRTWYGVQKDTILPSIDKEDFPTLEVDGRGIVWCFRWRVDSGSD